MGVVAYESRTSQYTQFVIEMQLSEKSAAIEIK